MPERTRSPEEPERTRSPEEPERTRSPEDLFAGYCGVRARVRAAVESVPTAALDARCPATPDWRVHDVLAHLVGVPNDVLAGRLEGVATDPWTQAQVDARRDTTAAEMLDAWDADGTAMEPLFAVVGFERFGQMLFDAITHENDLCHALRRWRRSREPRRRLLVRLARGRRRCVSGRSSSRAYRARRRGDRSGRASRHDRSHALRVREGQLGPPLARASDRVPE